MIVEFEVHGLGQIVEGNLDIQDAPVPQIGWELNFDWVGQMRVTGIHTYYVVLGEHRVVLELSGSRRFSAVEVVEFFQNTDDLTAFSGVELGDFCHCQLCS